MDALPNYMNDELNDWFDKDTRMEAYRLMMAFINYELVEGDILEFGVGNGKSLAMLTREYIGNINYFLWDDQNTINRRIVGFDSFEGLPTTEGHPRWVEGICATNYEFGHPFLKLFEEYSTDTILTLFKTCELPVPIFEIGMFDETIPKVIPSMYSKAAMVHIDCDLYESAKQVLNRIEPILQNGTLLLFDDYYCFKGDPNQGEALALKEFLAENPKWDAIPYIRYSAFCHSFIMRKKEEAAE